MKNCLFKKRFLTIAATFEGCLNGVLKLALLIPRRGLLNWVDSFLSHCDAWNNIHGHLLVIPKRDESADITTTVLYSKIKSLIDYSKSSVTGIKSNTRKCSQSFSLKRASPGILASSSQNLQLAVSSANF